MENRTIYNCECENEIIDVNNYIMATSEQDVEQDVEQDDFDRLLDEFIRESMKEDNEAESDNAPLDFDDSDDDSDDDDDSDSSDDDDSEFGDTFEEEDSFEEFNYGSVEYKLGSTKYLLPKHSYCVCKAEKLLLTYNCDDNRELRGEPLAFLSEDGGNKLFLTLQGIKKSDKIFKPVIYVYAASEDYPIKRFAFNIDSESDKESIANLVYLIDEIPAGNYFFYMWGVEIEGLSERYKNSGGGFFIPFVKVCGDKSLPAVALDEVETKIGKSERCLNVSFRFDTMLDKRYAYSLYMYNRSYNLVACSATFAWDSFGNRKRKNLTATLRAEYPLFGEYDIFIMQNGTPLYKLKVSIDNGKVALMCQSAVRPFGAEYLMLTELERKSSWHIFRELCAPVAIKEYFLSTYMRQNLNTIRRSKGFTSLNSHSHFVYLGGSSKKELKALDNMSYMFKNTSGFQSADCINLTEAKNTADPYGDAAELFENCIGRCIALYNISALVSNGSVVVKKMIDAMRCYATLTVCLIGNASEIAQLFELYPKLKHFFPDSNYISAGKMYGDILVAQVIKELKACDLFLSPAALALLTDKAKKAEKMGVLYSLTEVMVSEFVKKGIVDNFVSRTISSLDDMRANDMAFLTTVEACDINGEMLVKGTEQEFEDSIRELNMMVGLNDVKKNIITTFNRLKNNAERRRLGLKVKSGECHHMIFTGNPGTGKTTVAKMMGRIYRALGLLSKGEVVYTDRSKIVGRYIGDTERNMQRILLEAKGNILFIDEAYTLCDTLQDRKDFGYRAIECLLTVMAQENCDMIVIFAGYAKEMALMMQSNQGLQGRFPYKFDFKDYTAEELMQIAEYKLSQGDYELTDEARSLLRKTIDEAVDNKGWSFSNARWIEQYVDNGIVSAQSDRLTQCNEVMSRDDYRSVTVEDVRVAYALHKPVKEVKKVYREIGFTA